MPRLNVNDYFSITALHYLNAAGHDHFHFLLNAVISEINIASLPELKTIYAHVLYKGHGKDKTSETAFTVQFPLVLLFRKLQICMYESSPKMIGTLSKLTPSSKEKAALMSLQLFC